MLTVTQNEKQELQLKKRRFLTQSLPLFVLKVEAVLKLSSGFPFNFLKWSPLTYLHIVCATDPSLNKDFFSISGMFIFILIQMCALWKFLVLEYTPLIPDIQQYKNFPSCNLS